MTIEEIKNLPIEEQIMLIKKNCNSYGYMNPTVNYASNLDLLNTYPKIQQNILFFENDHPILHDEDKEDYWVMEDVETQDGSIAKESKRVRQTRLTLPYVQQIISNMIAFIYGNDIDLIMNGDRGNVDQQNAFAKFQDIWTNDTHIMSAIKKATRVAGIETRSTIQFLYDSDKEKIKAKVLSYRDGYKIYRHKDYLDHIDCILLEYYRDYIKDGELFQNVFTTEIWTKDGMDRYEGLQKIESTISPLTTKNLLFAYLEQDFCEFEFVKELISRQEYSRSTHSDVNTRIAFPALVVNGTLAKKPLYNATTKIYEIKGDGFDAGKSNSASMEYLEISSAPESVKLEMQNNENDIYRFTWPDLNKLMTDQKSGNLSTQSMKLTFLQAFVKVAEKREIHDVFISKIISIIKDMATDLYPEFKGMKDLQIGFNYNSILPDATSETVNMLAVAVGAGITSMENAVRILSFNTPETMKEIQKENLLKAIKIQQEPPIPPVIPNGVENKRNATGENGQNK